VRDLAQVLDPVPKVRPDELDPLELRRFAEEHFSPERMVADYVSAYETAIER
jgi:hypothetical protein